MYLTDNFIMDNLPAGRLIMYSFQICSPDSYLYLSGNKLEIVECNIESKDFSVVNYLIIHYSLFFLPANTTQPFLPQPRFQPVAK